MGLLMIDLEAPGALETAADMAKSLINEAGGRAAKYAWRLKPSRLASECVAQLWYTWRWANAKPIEAIKQRKFDRGNEGERRIVEYVRKGGWTVIDKDPTRAHKAPFDQFKFKALDGHLVAFTDGKCSHPLITGGDTWLFECKTMAKGRFNKLQTKRKIKVAEYEYYGQVCMYMKYFELPYCFWIAEDTETQDIYIEIVKRDDVTADRMIEVGTTIRDSIVRPARIAQSPTFGMCKSCDFLEQCHFEAKLNRNCRSCIYSQAAPNGQFYCTGWNVFIPNEEAILTGCLNYSPVS